MKLILRIGLCLLLMMSASVAMAAPVGYSVNSDAPEGDTLHRIDLETGVATPIGTKVRSSENQPVRSDTEGLAFSTNGQLWGVDELTRTLFVINKTTGLVMNPDVSIKGLKYLEGNDFGMTFSCDGSLYVSSIASETLYLLALDGTLTIVGTEGSLGTRISALAAWGNPAQLYGLGNGLFSDNTPDSRSLFRIDTATGVATRIGALGAQARDYDQAGLSFDDAGNLWALTDRSRQGLGSDILKINTETGAATRVSTTQMIGFESLAIAAPGDCEPALVNDSDLPSLPMLDRFGILATLLTFLITGLVASSRRFV